MKTKKYIVCKPGRRGKAFLSLHHEGFNPHPEEAARSEALEYFFDGAERGSYPTYRPVTNAVIIE